MPPRSAGLLPYRKKIEELEVLLVHPGGPFWTKRDDGAWTIAKGGIEPGEDPLAAAIREFQEETGFDAGAATFLPLGEIRQAGGKIVTAWAFEADLDAQAIQSNLFSMEWPPRSGKMKDFPEVDRAEWFTLEQARRKILTSQIVFLDRLAHMYGGT
jgi:predicted NUDIX family NTP pyrophosphohydrolase